MAAPDANAPAAESPERPHKSANAFRTISEVSDFLDVPQHVLRFWETKFTQIKPLKRGGRRRYYRPEDVLLLRGVRDLLYVDGYTIRGVQKLLREGGVRVLQDRGRETRLAAAAPPEPAAAPPPEPAVEPPEPAESPRAAPEGDPRRAALTALLDELEALRRMLDDSM